MGGKKKKKGKKAAKKEEEKKEETTDANPVLLEADTTKYVICHFHLLNWKFSQFVLKLPVQTRVFKIHKELVKQHGRIENVKICKHAYDESNELNDEMKVSGINSMLYYL